MKHKGKIGPASEIAPLLGMKPGFLKKLGRTRKVPSIRLGHRTILFNEDQVRAALEKFTVREIA